MACSITKPLAKAGSFEYERVLSENLSNQTLFIIGRLPLIAYPTTISVPEGALSIDIRNESTLPPETLMKAPSKTIALSSTWSEYYSRCDACLCKVTQGNITSPLTY